MPVLTTYAVPLSPLSRIFPTAMSLRRVTPIVGRGLLSIFVSQTVLPRCHHGLIPNTVSAMHASLSRILSSRDKNRHKHSLMIMTFVQLGGEGKGLRMQHDQTRRLVLTSVLYPDLSCRTKQCGKAARTYDRQSSGFHPISGRFRHVTPSSTPNAISASGGVTFSVFG